MPAGVEAVLLDGLGTLVALSPPALALVEQLRDALGVELAPADAERAFAAEIAYYRAHHHEGRDQATLADLRRRCAEALRARLPLPVARAISLEQLQEAMLGALRFTPYPDAVPAMRRLRARGLTLVVVSNWDLSLHGVLRDLGLAPLLDGVVTSADAGQPKPARAIFDAALALARAQPDRAVHVGDSVTDDVHGARAAGIGAVLLRREAGGAPPPADVPAITSLDGLLATLD
jgi:putative hydrolase of the HAD superfamily